MSIPTGKLWCFGDSFTFGHGCKPGEPYYDDYESIRGNIWSHILSKKLNLIDTNLGITGNSSEFILQQIILNLSEFTKNDIVIISDTLPLRNVMYNGNLNKITTMTTDWELKTHDDKKYSHIPSPFYRDNDEKHTLLNYIYSFLLPYKTQWSKYYRNQFDSLLKYLNNNGISTYFWSHTLWASGHRFERISNSTNGKILDDHFSWDGHKQFSNYLLERIIKEGHLPKSTLI
jgi:hypothetical protein